jgi:hypothetical protein
VHVSLLGGFICTTSLHALKEDWLGLAKLLHFGTGSCCSDAPGGCWTQGLIRRGLSWQVVDVQKALRRAQSGAREDSLENGAQDLLRRSLPEGTAFSSDSTSSSGPSQELPLVRTSSVADTACRDSHFTNTSEYHYSLRLLVLMTTSGPLACALGTQSLHFLVSLSHKWCLCNECGILILCASCAGA